MNGILRITCLLIIIGILPGCADRMFYHPSKTCFGKPPRVGLEYEKVFFNSLDGTMLAGWFVPAVGDEVKGTVVHFHGNAQNMSTHFNFVSWLPEEGYNVFVFDYRGYGPSQGKATKDGVYKDSCAAMKYIFSRTDIDQTRLFVIGQSLGGANALAALEEVGTEGVCAVLIDSTFYSYRREARDVVKQVPLIGYFRTPMAALFISNKYSPKDTVGEVSPVPLLFFHGTSDQVINYRHSELLFERASEPKSLEILPGGTHCSAMVLEEPTYREQVLIFFGNSIKAKREEEKTGTGW